MIVAEQVAGLAFEHGEKLGQGAKAQALDLAAAEQRELGFADVDRGGQFARLHPAADEHLVQGRPDRHQKIPSSSVCRARAWSTSRASRISAAPTTPRTMPDRSK